MRGRALLRVLSVSGAWVDGELRDIIELYDQMHQFAMSGEPYNKAAMIREAKGKALANKKPGELCIFSRSKGSIEMKLMNVSAACEALGRPDLSMAEHGYRPMKNMQKALKDAVEVWLAFEPYRGPIPDDSAITA